jgi:hypothetical protein
MMRARWLLFFIVLAASAGAVYIYMVPGEDLGERPETSFSPALKSKVFERELNSVHLLWKEGNNKEAKAQLLALYRSDFGQIREELRDKDPLGTLELEHGYGLLLQRFNRAAEEEEKSLLVKTVLDKTLVLLEKLPEPPPPIPSEG